MKLSTPSIRTFMRRGRSGRWHLKLAFAFLLALPATASAAGWWCVWIPWLPACAISTNSGPLTEVTAFGSNPGNLKMFKYVPNQLGASRPLVVALHGCKQHATDYDDEPGWIKLADKHRFALLLPEQQSANNLSRCFNWFSSGDNERDKGEALSIRQMIDKIRVDERIAPEKIYVTGLSAGGAMTAVMLATYPELFAGGAIIAGVPYKCASDVNEALNSCGVSIWAQLAPTKDLTRAQWGNLVRNASHQHRRLQRVSIWQGTIDTTVNPLNQRELIEQWTNVLGIDQVPDTEVTLNGHVNKLYKDNHGVVLLESVIINGMGHGTPIGIGNADNQCGIAASFVLDVGICSSDHIVKFWGLDLP